MPRHRDEVRRRLQPAALELYQEDIYETTTAAEIAEGQESPTAPSSRHFPDKREVLFDGEGRLSGALTSACVTLRPHWVRGIRCCSPYQSDRCSSTTVLSQSHGDASSPTVPHFRNACTPKSSP
jgi:hypothetical protein